MLSQESFTYPFKDTRWGGKFAIGSLLSLAGYIIPIVPTLFVLGYGMRLLRHTLTERTPRAPEWDDWGDLGLQGLFALLIYIVYLIPGILLMLSAIITFLAGQMLASARGRDVVARGLVSWVVGFGPLSIALAIVIFLLGLLVLFAGSLLAPMAMARFAATDNLARAFDLDEIWRVIRHELGNFVVIWAVILGYSYAVGFVTLILYYSICLCLLIPFVAGPAYFYGTLLSMPLFAQLYARGRDAIAQSPGAPFTPPGHPPGSRPVGAAEPSSEQSASPESSGPAAGERLAQTDSDSSPSGIAVQVAPVAVDPFEMSLGELDLPGRVEACLMDAGLVTVGHVMEALRAGEARLTQVKGFGPRSLDILKDRLADKGFAV